MDVEKLKELVHYDPDTGIFTHKRLDRIIGCVLHNGMVQISLGSKRYYAHRLAWLYMAGCWPDGFLDHVDRNPSNNRFSNLRECTPAENSQNTNAKGVTLQSWGTWRARIMLCGKSYDLGSFETMELASEAYKKAKRKLHNFYNEV